MDKVQEIMELVSKYGTAVHESSTGNPSNHTLAHEESAAYDAVKTALRALLERKPLSDKQIAKAAHDAYMSGNLSWAGFEKDQRGIHCVPVLSKSHYDLVRAAIQAWNEGKVE